MKYTFIVQGEGRGHLTQAMALYDLLTKNGHEVSCILVGHAVGGKVATFFKESVGCTVIGFESPHLIYSKKTKALSITKTLWNGVWHLSKFLKSISSIKHTINQHQPDCIINFYDGLAGIYKLLNPTPHREMVAIAHQYYLLHPDFPHPKHLSFDRFLVNLNSQITALGAYKKLALSFIEFHEDKINKIKAIPPLLRKEIKSFQLTDNDRNDFILAYITQPLYAEQLIRWQQQNTETVIHCFWSNPAFGKIHQVNENLTFHQIDAELFLMMMSSCKAFASTAGFESICEAFYLGKPCCMVPLPKHYEQACNAIDAQLAGAGIVQENFDLSGFMTYLAANKQPSNEDFIAWVSEAEHRFLEELVQQINEKVLT